jgi:hypothetical protein
MNFLLFVLEMILVLGGIALVPARPELSPSNREIPSQSGKTAEATPAGRKT